MSVMAGCSLVPLLVPAARVLYYYFPQAAWNYHRVCTSGPLRVAIFTPGVLEVQLT